ncbi:MAG: hypothetical protein WCJ02_13015, partial [bacterium]
RCLRSAFWRVLRSHRAADALRRLWAGAEYINRAHRHLPAFLAFDVSRYTPVTRPLMHLAPVRPLSGSIFGAELFCCEHLTIDASHGSPPKEKVALTAVQKGGDVTARGVRHPVPDSP